MRAPCGVSRYDKKMPKKTQDQSAYQASLHKVTLFVVYQPCFSLGWPRLLVVLLVLS